MRRSEFTTGVFPTPAGGVKKFVVRDRIFEPDPARHRAYQERYAKYRQLFPLMRDFLR